MVNENDAPAASPDAVAGVDARRPGDLAVDDDVIVTELRQRSCAIDEQADFGLRGIHPVNAGRQGCRLPRGRPLRRDHRTRLMGTAAGKQRRGQQGCEQCCQGQTAIFRHDDFLLSC